MKQSIIPMCSKGCCKAAIVPYTRKWTPSIVSDEERRIRRKKAGVFVYDRDKNKLLLVQSCGRFWGPPKGSMEQGEDVETAAIRELREETGVVLTREDIEGKRVYMKNSSHHFFIYMGREEHPVVQDGTPGGNDANGVGWFDLECLRERVGQGKFAANSTLKQFLAGNHIEKVLGIANSLGSLDPAKAEVEEGNHDNTESEEV
jgi:8-oxo-dGTP pyrophosphatase MutT (NUDIX family)